MSPSRPAGSRKLGNATIGAIGVVVISLLTVMAFFLDELPVIGAGKKYTAEFSEAAGLKPADEVRVAGVKVGKVTDIELDGDVVAVEFRVSDTWVGDDSKVAIAIKSVLGRKYLALVPAGSKEQDPDQRIGVDRTASPYDVLTAFSSAAETLEQIDTDQLAGSLDTLTATMEGTPEDFRSAVDGMGRLSQSLSTRDAELRRLLIATRSTSRILADRNDDFRQLISATGQLLAELNARSESINLILAASRGLSRELSLLVAENEAQFGPTLNQLDSVLANLNNHDEQLRAGVSNLVLFYRLYANITGSGRWFDSVVVNLTPPGLPILGGRPPANNQGPR